MSAVLYVCLWGEGRQREGISASAEFLVCAAAAMTIQHVNREKKPPHEAGDLPLQKRQTQHRETRVQNAAREKMYI